MPGHVWMLLSPLRAEAADTPKLRWTKRPPHLHRAEAAKIN